MYGTHGQTQSFGAFNPTGGGTYYLQSSINSTQTTIALSSFTEPGTNVPYTMAYLNSSIEFATINPIGAGNPTGNKSEFVSFTGITQNSNGTALLTGVTRGLSRSYPYTASSTQAYSAPGQTQFILSSPPQFYNQYANLSNSQVITGQWQFTTLPTSSVACTSGTQFCNKAYIDAGLNQGAATSTFTNLGLVWLANSTQVLAGTASSTSGAPLVIPNKNATSTPTVSCTNYACIPVAIGGKISQLFLDLTQAFNVSGLWNFSATTTFATTTAASSTIKIANIATASIGTATIGALTASSFTGPLGLLIGTTTASSTTYSLSQSASTGEMTLTSVSIPANTLGTANVLNVDVPLGFSDNVAGASILIKVKYGGTTLFTGGTYTYASGAPNLASGFLKVKIIGNGATNSQYDEYSYQASANTGNNAIANPTINDLQNTTSSVDTTSSQNLVITVTANQGGTGGGSFTFGALPGVISVIK